MPDILVDEQDVWLLTTYKWHITKSGHVRTSVRGRNVFLHNCIVGVPLQRNFVVDHIDRNPLNNKRDNLRYATKANNRLNSKNITPMDPAIMARMRALRGADGL